MIDRVIEEIVGPTGGLSRGFAAHLALCALDEVESGLTDDSHVLGSVVSSEPGQVVVEDDVQDPVQPVFDVPVVSCGLGNQRGGCGQRSNIEVAGASRLGTDFAFALDHGNGDEAGPTVALSEPVDVVCDPVPAGLDAAVVGIDGLVEVDTGPGEAGLVGGVPVGGVEKPQKMLW